MSQSGSIKILNTANDLWPKDHSIDTAWIFANNVSIYSDISKSLPDGIILKQSGDEINTIASRLHDEFNNIDQKLVQGRFYQSWLASNLGAQNPYTSDFILNICQFIALIEAVQKGGKHCVIVDDHNFGELIIKTCRDNKIKASWHYPVSKSPEYSWLKVIRALLSGLKYSINQIIEGKKWQGKNAIQSDGVLLVSWADSNSFNPNIPKNHDAAFGVLPQWIRDLGYKPHWLANPLAWLETMSSIVSNASAAYDVAIPMPSLITFKDIGAAIWGWVFFPLAVNTNLRIARLNLSALVRHYVRKELSSPQIIQALLLRNIAKNLKCRKMTPRILVYTYENQPWEKIILSSFRQHLPNTKLIGVQHAPLSDRYLSVYPSIRQWKEKTTPDTLVTIGRDFQKQLIVHKAPPERIVIGGSLRMPHLADDTSYFQIKTNDQVKRILVSCPMQTTEAIELSVKVACATQNINDVEVMINFHPLSPSPLINSIKKTIRQLTQCSHIKFVEGSVHSWLNKSQLLIYNSSGTVFDAASRGVPSIYVGSDNGLDLDKMPGGNRLNCRTPEELENIIHKLIEDTSLVQEIVQHARNSLRYNFSPPDPKIWNKILSSIK